MKLKKLNTVKSFLAITLLLLTTITFAQTDASKGRFLDKVSFGGGVGLNFGNGNFSASVSPSAIYNFNEYVSAGPSLIYSYQSNDFFNSSLYGGSIIGLFNPIRQVQLSTELEQLRVNQTIKTTGTDVDNDFWNTAFFVGAGYRANNITFGVRYNLLYKDGDSVYADAWAPFVRVYF